MPDYPKTKLTQIAGYVGAAPEIRQGNGGADFTTFRVGVNEGYADDEETRWVGVAINDPQVQDFVNGKIRKGTPVVVEGHESTSERNGVTYNNMNGYRVGIVDWFVKGRAPQREDEDL
jgi:single-stranded DNA-binding protein